MRKILITIILATTLLPLFSQPGEVIDKIIAVVGSDIVLLSDLETQYLQFVASGNDIQENTKCMLYEEQLFQALLLNQAKIDSITVAESQVETELDRRLRYFISQFGSEEKLEEFYEKSIVEIKAEFYNMIKDQLLMQSMQQNLTSGLKVSPAEVRAYYNSIPKDSLPFINSEVEVAHIVKKPPISEAEKKRVKDKLKGFRKRVLNGEDFGTIAYLYSEDPGSAKKNGELGFLPRNALVPEFARIAFNIKPGQVSEIVETDYGYHIIQFIARKGSEVNVRHILLSPKIIASDMVKAMNFLDSISNVINTVDTIDFNTAAIMSSDDKETRNNGGLLVNPQTGTTKFEMDQVSQVDPSLFFVIDKMEPGDISKPVVVQLPDGSSAYRIVKLLSRSAPHKANLKDDYQRIQDAALSEKQGKTIMDWINKNISKTYIKIDDDYKNCDFDNNWQPAQ